MCDDFPHGTVTGYNRRCRCIDCKDAMRAYCAEKKGITHHRGVILTIDEDALRHEMERSHVTEADIARNLGIHSATVHTWFKRRRVGLYTLDAIAQYLGTHYTLLTTDDCVSVAS